MSRHRNRRPNRHRFLAHFRHHVLSLGLVDPYANAAQYWIDASICNGEESRGFPPPLCSVDDEGDVAHTVDKFNLMWASWQVARLVLGPDDGSIDRDDIECQIQRVLSLSFAYTARNRESLMPPTRDPAGEPGA